MVWAGAQRHDQRPLRLQSEYRPADRRLPRDPRQALPASAGRPWLRQFTRRAYVAVDGQSRRAALIRRQALAAQHDADLLDRRRGDRAERIDQPLHIRTGLRLDVLADLARL